MLSNDLQKAVMSNDMQRRLSTMGKLDEQMPIRFATRVVRDISLTCPSCGAMLPMSSARADVSMFERSAAVEGFALCNDCEIWTSFALRLNEDGGLLVRGGSGWLPGQTIEKRVGFFRRAAAKIMGFFAVAAAVCCVTTSPVEAAKQPARVIDGVVTRVSDGDTINVQDALGTKVRVRFYGMDAPETEKSNRRTGKISKPGQPFGEDSLAALRGKLDRQRVRLEVMDVDKYGRLVSLVWVGDRCVNLEMVAEGWAWAYRKYLGKAHQRLFIEAESRARSGRLGLWRDGLAEPPWDFRKRTKTAGD
jgi:endonuclease YncB( thermonuclease family)